MALEQLPQFMASIAALESGGGNPANINYNAQGIQTKYGRALGAYQIMEQWFGDWASEAGYAGADWRDPRVQDAIARHKMTAYYNQFGSWDLVAIAWFAGPGRAREAQRAGVGSLSGIADGLGTTVPAYVAKIEQIMGGLGASPARASAGGGSYMQAGADPAAVGAPTQRQAVHLPGADEVYGPAGAGGAAQDSEPGAPSAPFLIAREVLNNLSRVVAENPDSEAHTLATSAFQRMYPQSTAEPTHLAQQQAARLEERMA
jgi:hypothetical protein